MIMHDPALQDDQKEAAMRKASIGLFKAFVGIVLRFIVCLLAALLPIWIADAIGWIAFDQAIAYLSRWDVIGAITGIMVAIWWFARVLGRKDGDGYSFLDRTLHRIALGGSGIPNVLLDIEMSRFGPSSPSEGLGPHIIICGLARAGTTVLARDIYATGEFGSLTYRDMPFVMAPNSFSGLSKSATIDKKERSHGDGLMVDLDSPEALDEVFWRLKAGQDYIQNDRLVPHSPTDEQIAAYSDFQRLVLLKTGKQRYLAKSNNSCLRLQHLAKRLPDTLFLVPFRSPWHQCQSLIRQQHKFTGGTQFQRDYMIWLVHHEFGDTHKPFVFEGVPSGQPDQIDYWRQIWIATYLTMADIADRYENVVLVSYNDLCTDHSYRAALLERAGLGGFEFSELHQVDTACPDNLENKDWAPARTLYERMRVKALAILPGGEG